MIISFDKKFIFTHVPKTAGTSISSILQEYRYTVPESVYCKTKNRLFRAGFFGLDSLLKPNYKEFNYFNHTHLTISGAKNILPDHIFNCLFKFAIVRHPVDWQYSMYRHILKKHRDAPSRHIFEPVFKHESFYEYIKWRIDTNFIAPQVLQLVDESGNISVDKIYRFESLSSSFKDICMKLGINEKLPYKNIGTPLREDVDKKTISIILDKFSIDFEIFSYGENSVNPFREQNFRQYSELIDPFRRLKADHPSFSLWSKVPER